MITTEELLGLIKGLGEAVKGQLKAHSKSQTELQQLTAAVGNLVESSSNSYPESVPKNLSSVSTRLRLQQVTLPVYKGQPNENLNRFTNTLTSLLKSSGLPSLHWTTYLKQQVQVDSRAYDIVDRAEQEHLHILGENPQTSY